MFKNLYSFARLIFITAILIYFVGIVYYSLSRVIAEYFNKPIEHTISSYNNDEPNWIALTTMLYFTMTTVAKVGYGDYSPISDSEKLMALIILVVSVVFFSYVLEQF